MNTIAVGTFTGQDIEKVLKDAGFSDQANYRGVSKLGVMRLALALEG